MRKLFLILLALAGCLLFSESRGSVHAAQGVRTAVFSVGDAHADQWQCERVCNSDLNQPRVLREAEASPATPLSLRGSLQGPGRNALRCAALCGGGTGIAKLFSSFQSVDPAVGMHAVDYYVYRLHRLII